MTHGQQGSYHFVYQHFELDTSFILRYIEPFLFIYLFCMSVNRVRWVARRVLYFSLVTKQQCLFSPFVTLSNFFRYRRSVLQILLSFWTLINVCVKEFKNVHFITAVCSTNIESPRVCVILCSYLYQADIFKWRMKYTTNLKETQTNTHKKRGKQLHSKLAVSFSDVWLMLGIFLFSVSVMLSANDSETAWSSLRLFDCACITYNFYY